MFEIVLVICITVVVLALMIAACTVYMFKLDCDSVCISKDELKRLQEEHNNLYALYCDLKKEIDSRC